MLKASGVRGWDVPQLSVALHCTITWLWKYGRVLVDLSLRILCVRHGSGCEGSRTEPETWHVFLELRLPTFSVDGVSSF